MAATFKGHLQGTPSPHISMVTASIAMQALRETTPISVLEAFIDRTRRIRAQDMDVAKPPQAFPSRMSEEGAEYSKSLGLIKPHIHASTTFNHLMGNQLNVLQRPTRQTHSMFHVHGRGAPRLLVSGATYDRHAIGPDRTLINQRAPMLANAPKCCGHLSLEHGKSMDMPRSLRSASRAHYRDCAPCRTLARTSAAGPRRPRQDMWGQVLLSLKTNPCAPRGDQGIPATSPHAHNLGHVCGSSIRESLRPQFGCRHAPQHALGAKASRRRSAAATCPYQHPRLYMKGDDMTRKKHDAVMLGQRKSGDPPLRSNLAVGEQEPTPLCLMQAPYP